MSEQKVIKRYISRKLVGYTASRNPIFKCEIEYTDGSTGIVEEIGEKTEVIASYVQDRFIPINCCILDYANQRLYSVDRRAYFRLDGDRVVLIQEGDQSC